MKKYLALFFIFVLVIGWSCSGSDDKTMAQDIKKETTAKASEKSDGKVEVKWLKFDEGLAKGAKENKNIIVDFYTDWCHWCKVMDEKTFKNPKIAKKLSEKFVTIRLNAESRTEKVHFQGHEFTNAQLTQAFRVTGFPSLGFITPKHEVITVIPGYIPAEQFGFILDYIEQECYKKNVSLQEFIDKKGNCDSTKAKTM